ncbi:restriction endonuclease [Bacteroidetes/Chlorobi group bacterium ChocPot_Mid]|nr:MAG: restriction endonuclease [Bacteroidetes/Chlorobi group bacterium ChocPot_Mid]
MPIPDFQSIMLPLLKLISDGKEYSFQESIELLATQFNLTANEKKEMLASGSQPIFTNRVGWAKTYLKKAGLIEQTRRGYFIITKTGLDTLKSNITSINKKFLKKFPAFQESMTKKKEEDDDNDNNQLFEQSKTPIELIEAGYKTLRDNLVQDLINEIKKLPPDFFEKIVIDLLVKMGYGGSLSDQAKVTGKSGDEGIDGLIKEDKLGLDTIYIQAKRWENQVSRPEIQKFAGALLGQQSKKGIFITLSNFSKAAIEYAEKIDAKIILIDGEQLAEYMIDYNVGVSVTNSYEIKKIDSDYFSLE